MQTPFTEQQFFEYEMANGLNAENPNYKRLHYLSADIIADTYEEKFGRKPHSVLELGAGMGTCLEKFLQMGIAATGMDRNSYHKAYFDNRNPTWAQHYQVCDFTERQLLHYDVIFSIEVFEHIADKDLQRIYAQLAASCDMFVFSSTPFAHEQADFDEQWGHINIKSEQDWIKLFLSYGFLPNPIQLLQLPTEWTKVFFSQYAQDRIIKPIFR